MPRGVKYAPVPDRICEVCNGPFNRTRYQNGRLEPLWHFNGRNLCSTKCKYAKMRTHDVDTPRFCEFKKCKKLLVRNRHGNHLEHPKDFCARRFCNDDCWYRSQRRVAEFPHKKCLHCTNKMEPGETRKGVKESPYHFARRHFCNRECYDLWLDEHWGEGVWKLLRRLKRENNARKD